MRMTGKRWRYCFRINGFGEVDAVDKEATKHGATEMRRPLGWERGSLGKTVSQKLRFQGLVLILSKDLVMSLYPGGTTKRKEEHSSVPLNPE